MDSSLPHRTLQNNNNKGVAGGKIHLDDIKGPYEGCAGNWQSAQSCSLFWIGVFF